MLRYLWVVLATVALCLAVTGLRVTLLTALPVEPGTPLVAPRTIREEDPPPAAPPVETIAREPDIRAAGDGHTPGWAAMGR